MSVILWYYVIKYKFVVFWLLQNSAEKVSAMYNFYVDFLRLHLRISQSGVGGRHPLTLLCFQNKESFCLVHVNTFIPGEHPHLMDFCFCLLKRCNFCYVSQKLEHLRVLTSPCVFIVSDIIAHMQEMMMSWCAQRKPLNAQSNPVFCSPPLNLLCRCWGF